jgi:hypothetical protein
VTSFLGISDALSWDLRDLPNRRVLKLTSKLRPYCVLYKGYLELELEKGFRDRVFGGSSPCPGLKRSVGKELEELLRT